MKSYEVCRDVSIVAPPSSRPKARYVDELHGHRKKKEELDLKNDESVQEMKGFLKECGAAVLKG